MKEMLVTMLVAVSIADGERKGDCERKEGAARTRKRCAFKDSCFLCAGSHHDLRKKKFTWFFVGFPLPHRGLTWFYNKRPYPFNGACGLCTIPNVKSRTVESKTQIYK